ncbi:MAG: DUF2520 domain-containing protein [Candidatus Riflebacteria bacterium]|nr:DUF2520 domain-containing protein [Candidatus Riflebacteria bacterium]
MRNQCALSECCIGIIGSGKLADAVVPYLLEHKQKIAGIWSRNKKKACKIASRDGISVFDTVSQLVQHSRILILAVTDDAIDQVVESISETSLKGYLVIHSSGCLPLDILQPASLAGAETAVIHPLMTLARLKNEPNPLNIAPVGLVCSSKKIEQSLIKWFSGIGQEVFRISPESRPLYHAAAVLACAGLHQLFMTSAQLFEVEGICTGKKAEKLLMPIVKRTLELGFHSKKVTITGPWSRQDSQTIRLHLKALKKSHPKIFRLYKCLMDLSREEKVNKTG